jgi:photosystem II stability/assembly factor-like uncharacterized protein
LTLRRGRFSLISFLLLLGFICADAHAVRWFPFGPDGGDARSLASDPSDHKHLYLGTTNGWIYQSADGGRTWSRLASVGLRDDLVVDHILVDPTDPKHLIAGAWVVADLQHPDGGVYISHDAGVTWTSQPEMQGQSVRALAFAPSDAKILVAGTLNGVYRSMDAGTHWQLISDKSIYELASVAVDPVDPKTIYAGTWHLPWKTTDGGATWTSIKEGIIDDSDVFSILVDPKQSSVVYVSACSGIYKSDDAGANFTKAPGIPADARRTRVLMQDPGHLDTVYAGTTEGLYRTDDAGKVWVEATSPDHIVNDVYVDPSNPKHILLATDHEGVLVSDDGGVSFTPSNSGFSTRLVAAYVADARHPATLYVGVLNDKQWGGVFVSRTGGLSWSQLSDGLGGLDVFSLGQAPDGTILAGTVHGIFRLHDGAWGPTGDDKPAAATTGTAAGKKADGSRKMAAGRSRAVAKRGSGAVAAGPKGFDGSVYEFARTGETLYAATAEGLLRSDSSGSKWSVVSSMPVEDWHFVAASKSNVVAANLNAVEVSVDNGNTWREVKLPTKVTQVMALSVDGEGEVWVAGREGVYCSSDRGENWLSPLGPYGRNANSIFYDEASNRMLVTSSGSASLAFSVQLPTMKVTPLETGWNLRFLRPVGDHLVAGTLFDGIVVQPRMVESPEPGATTAQR